MDTETILTNVALDSDELLKSAMELAKLITKQESYREEKKESSKDFNDLIKGLKPEINIFRREILTSSREVRVECVISYDFEKNLKIFKDAKSGQELDRRELTEDERQLDLSNVE